MVTVKDGQKVKLICNKENDYSIGHIFTREASWLDDDHSVKFVDEHGFPVFLRSIEIELVED